MSDSIDLSYQQALIAIDDQTDSLVSNNPNYIRSSLNIISDENLMELYGASNALDAFEFILSFLSIPIGEYIDNNQNYSAAYRRQLLMNLLQNYDKKRDLTNLFADFYVFFDIYLYFIQFKQHEFGLINDYTFPDRTKQRKIAFVVLNRDQTICGPLFAHVNTGIQTVFTSDDISVTIHVDKYIERLNRTDRRLIPLTKEYLSSAIHPDHLDDNQQVTNICMDTLVNNHSALINGPNSEILDPRNHLIEGHSLSSANDPVPSLVQRPNESNRGNDDSVHQSMEADPPSTASSSNHISNSMQHSQTVPGPSSTSIIYPAQKISTQPKPDWTVRYAKDLILKTKKPPKGLKRPRGKKTNKKRFTGFLQGIGGQRSQIKTKVPKKGRERMYQAAAVRTVKNEKHPLKVIVPDGTKVNEQRVNHENKLDYLEFDQCSSNDFFDPTTQINYMKITSEEHRQGYKEVPIYMFNLYQNSQLTKELIRSDQLDQCQLAFWLCVKRNGQFVSVSPESYSNIINEKKRKRKGDPP